MNESEFCFKDDCGKRKNYYENSIIYKCIYNRLVQSIPQNDLIRQIISEYSSVKTNIQSLIVEGYYSDLQLYREIILESEDDNPIELKEYIDGIIKCEDSLATRKDRESLNALVGSFFNICQKAIFSHKNDILVDGRFGKSDFIKELICPVEKSKLSDTVGCYKYNLNDPFVAAALIRIANNIENRLNDTIDDYGQHLTYLRNSLYALLSERLFNRFLNINRESYRLFLNRHSSEFFACARADLSSIDDVKPLRLFEKIISFITKKVKSSNDDIINIKICIIGHTEATATDDLDVQEPELCDLVKAIINWFSVCYSNKFLKLTVLNLINKYDFTAVNLRMKDNDNISIEKEYEKNGNIGCFKVYSDDYKLNFDYSTKYLCNIINEHDITFILDCPWLTREDFELNKTVSMNYFCKKLDGYKLEDAIGGEINPNQTSMMRNLNVQFNRIMGSDSFDAGQIIRILKDTIPRRIEETLKKSFVEEKVVYLFLSESTGINYSYLNYYPLQRVELYASKRFDIFQFCNYKVPAIDCAEKDICFKVRLWSIIKYISISYAFDYFRDIIYNIAEKHSTIELDWIDYFDVYRCVIIQMSAKKIGEISIDIQFERRIKQYFDKDGIDTLYKEVYALINPLFKEILFPIGSSRNDICDSQIRLAFSMNLYSSAKTGYEMYFWHKYNRSINSSDFELFKKITVNNTNDSDEELTFIDLLEDEDYFKDKWLYKHMLDYFESNDEVTINQSYVINNTAPKYYDDYCIDKEFVKNLTEVCGYFNKDDDLYLNCKKALSIL